MRYRLNPAVMKITTIAELEFELLEHFVTDHVQNWLILVMTST